MQCDRLLERAVDRGRVWQRSSSLLSSFWQIPKVEDRSETEAGHAVFLPSSIVCMYQTGTHGMVYVHAATAECPLSE